MKIKFIQALVLGFTLFLSNQVMSNSFLDWNLFANQQILNAKLKTPAANRVMALMHTSMAEVCKQSTTSRQTNLQIDSLIISAGYQALAQLLPKQRDEINKGYEAHLAESGSKAIRPALERQTLLIVKKVFTTRQVEEFSTNETYRPYTKAGKYVPTTIPAAPMWMDRKPWFLESPKQFRAPAPLALDSRLWAKNLNEVKELGAKQSLTRTDEQSAIAKFWQATLPPIYHGVVHSVAKAKNYNSCENAHLFALVTQAIDDAMIAVFEAKYHYAFWRPITAIRNADLDGTVETQREPGWRPFIPTPMHPEYPCAHCVVASTVGTILANVIGDDSVTLSTRSRTLGNTQRSWLTTDSFISEVSEARIYDGVHYRFSTVAGNQMGIKIGKLALRKY